MTMFEDVLAFHEKYGAAIGEYPHIPGDAELALRERLIDEEYLETKEAFANRDLEKIADGITDLIYVLLGTGATFGIDMDHIFRIVHESNMSKDGGSDAGGKIIKGPGFIPPDIKGALEEQGAWMQ